MAVKITGNSIAKPTFDYSALSTDTKPTDCETGSTLITVDTSDVWYFHDGTWYKL